MGVRGGPRRGAGRPTKVKEEHIKRLGLSAIKEVYGSVEKYYVFIAEKSKESYPHLKLLQEYIFGKPREQVEMTIGEGDESGIDYSKLSMKALLEIKNATIKNSDDYDGSDDDLY